MKIESVGTSYLNKADSNEQKTVVVQYKKTTPIQAGKQSKEVAPNTTQTRNKDNVMSTALEEIKKRECGNGPHTTSYPDGHGYTIGCGTRSYRGEIITAKVAYDRLYDIVNSMYGKMNGRYSRMTDNQLAATISLGFNCHTCLAGVKQGITQKTWESWSRGKVRNKDGKVVSIYMGGLRKRRVSEYKLYIKE